MARGSSIRLRRQCWRSRRMEGGVSCSTAYGVSRPHSTNTSQSGIDWLQPHHVFGNTGSRDCSDHPLANLSSNAIAVTLRTTLQPHHRCNNLCLRITSGPLDGQPDRNNLRMRSGARWRTTTLIFKLSRNFSPASQMFASTRFASMMPRAGGRSSHLEQKSTSHTCNW